MIKINYLKFIVILVILLIKVNIYAQGPSSPGFDPDISPSVPVDGGLSLLVLAGVGYGIKKNREKKAIEK